MRNGNNQPLHARAGQQTGFPSTEDNHDTGWLWSCLGHGRVGQRMIAGVSGVWGCRGGGMFSGQEENQGFFSFWKRDIPPLFQGRMDYPLRLVTLGILFQLGSFCCNSRAEQRNSGWQGFEPRCERKKFLPRISPIVSSRINIYRESSSEGFYNGHGFKTKPLKEYMKNYA